MGFAGELRLGFVVRIEGKFVGAFGGAEPFAKAKSVRLPGGGLLFYEEK